MRKSNLKSIEDIDTTTDEGAVLLMAIGVITSSAGYTDKTPDEVLKVLNKMTEDAVW